MVVIMWLVFYTTFKCYIVISIEELYRSAMDWRGSVRKRMIDLYFICFFCVTIQASRQAQLDYSVSRDNTVRESDFKTNCENISHLGAVSPSLLVEWALIM